MVLEPNNLYNGDCLEMMSGIADESVQQILADLPYGVLNRQNKAARWDCVLPFDELWRHYERIIKPNGAIVLFGQGMFTARLMMSNAKMWRYNLIWCKGSGVTGFLNANRQPMRNHEDICVFYKRQCKYNPQFIKDGRKHRRGGNNGNSYTYGNFHKLPEIETNTLYPRSVVSISNDTSTTARKHPTEKPVGLLSWLVRTYTDEGDLVLDNTMGSGSTCVACVREKRRYIGIEKEPKYYEIAVKRVRDAEVEMKQNLFG